MKIAGEYSFADGTRVVNEQYGPLLEEIRTVLSSIDAEAHRTKVSKELTMIDRKLFSPADINATIKQGLTPLGWKNHREPCIYSTQYYVDGYRPKNPVSKAAFRDMDFVKDRLGVEVQFGKYAFMVYNVAAKMTIFRKFGIIDAGIEIVPVKEFAEHMSSGVSFFEQFCWDLEKRGVSDIDTPVMVIGIAAD